MAGRFTKTARTARARRARALLGIYITMQDPRIQQDYPEWWDRALNVLYDAKLEISGLIETELDPRRRPSLDSRRRANARPGRTQ